MHLTPRRAQILNGQHHNTRVAAILAACSATATDANTLQMEGILQALHASLRAGVAIPSSFMRKHDTADPTKGARFDVCASRFLCLLAQEQTGRRLLITPTAFKCIKVR